MENSTSQNHLPLPSPEISPTIAVYRWIILLLLLLIPVVGVTGYYLGAIQEKESTLPDGITTPGPSNTPGVACTMEAKICPDGSSVGRVGPNCEFAECPVAEQKSLFLRFTTPPRYEVKEPDNRYVDVVVSETVRLSPTSVMINGSKSNSTSMRIHGTEYTIQITGGSGGICPFGEREDYWCKRDEESFPQSQGLLIWKDSQYGIFALNTMGLKINDTMTDVIMISKKEKNSFSTEEVNLWKEILGNIQLIEQN